MRFYALRFLPHVAVKDRKHHLTQPGGRARFDTWVEADDARELSPVADQLEVVERETRPAVTA